MNNIEKDFDLEQAERFLDSIFAFSDEQLSALARYTPMTQKIFEECLGVCVQINNVGEFNSIWDNFPEQAEVFAKKVDNELKDIPDMDDKELQKCWEDLKNRIRKKYGEDVI